MKKSDESRIGIRGAAILMPLSSLTVIVSSYRALTFRTAKDEEAPSCR